MSHADTVRGACEAFGRADIATILDEADDDLERETAVRVWVVPWRQARRGEASAQPGTLTAVRDRPAELNRTR